MDFRSISREVYDLANSDDLLAAPVREALEVIDESLDTYRWVEDLCWLTSHLNMYGCYKIAKYLPQF